MPSDLAALIAEAEAIIATFCLPFSRDHAKAKAINLLPRIVTALRQRPGREEVERALYTICDMQDSYAEAVRADVRGDIKQTGARLKAGISDLLELLGYGDER